MTAHIILDALKIVNKLHPSLVLETAKRLSRELLVLFYRYHTDIAISNSILDIVVQIFEDSLAREFFLACFIPAFSEYIPELASPKFCNSSMVSMSEDDNRLSFLNALLDIHILAIRKCQRDSPKIIEQLLQPFDIIVKIAANSQNDIPVVKCTICIKSYLLYLYPELEQRKLLPGVYTVLERLLKPKESENRCAYVGNILMIVFEKVASPHGRFLDLICTTSCWTN